MDIVISNLSDVPIYQQIAIQIRSSILNETLQNNFQLPSIRNLAKELEVGIITVKKAYEVLLQEKLIYSKGAVGYFVSSIDSDEIRSIKREKYFNEFNKLCDSAIADGLEINNIKEIINEILEENYYDKRG